MYKMALESKLFHKTEIQPFKKIEEIFSTYNERLCVVHI